jgi:epoxyqueuosine reductase
MEIVVMNQCDETLDLCRRLGADFAGAADLGPAREAMVAQGGTLVADYPRALSVGVRLMDTLVDALPHHHERIVGMNYRHHGYDVVNARLDQLVSRTASALQGQGYRALPIPASQGIDAERLCGLFSHKMAAHLAGLGWIGKSCCLITPAAGPRVRWATVLTDAPLTPGVPMAERCGDCTVCVDACPAQAFTGAPFASDEPREARFDALACRDYQRGVQEETGYSVCGMCLHSCPHGQQPTERQT